MNLLKGALAIAFVAVGLAACTQAGETPTSGTEGSTTTANASPTTETSTVDGLTVCWTGPVDGKPGPLQWSDGTSESGLETALLGMRGHAAGWGDVDGDGLLDLVVGTFATSRQEVYQERGASGPSPDQLLIGGEDGRFTPALSLPEQFGRTSGVAMADLDVDGDVDVVLSRNVNGRDPGPGTAIFENSNDVLEVVEAGIDPDLGGRSIGVIDVDADGLLDLVVLEDRYRGGSSQVYRNLGSLQFELANSAFGFPSDVHGLGLATGDLNNDGFTDLFVAGSNRMFFGTGEGLVEVPDAIPAWEMFGSEDDVAGAAIADVNRDGWLDVVVGHHYNSTLSRGNEVPVRLYLNRTGESGPDFEDVTEAAGLVGIPTKAPHVEFADIDNDGWPDIVTSASAESGSVPAVFHHTGIADGIPVFAPPQGLGSAQYWVTAPTADVNRDGRLDLLAVEWEPSLPSVLFVNDSDSGHWVEVVVDNVYGGIGSRVEIYEFGSLGSPSALLGAREIVATLGYTAGAETVAHFGVGEATNVDVRIIDPFGGETLDWLGVPTDQRVSTGGC